MNEKKAGLILVSEDSNAFLTDFARETHAKGVNLQRVGRLFMIKKRTCGRAAFDNNSARHSD